MTSEYFPGHWAQSSLLFAAQFQSSLCSGVSSNLLSKQRCREVFVGSIHHCIHLFLSLHTTASLQQLWAFLCAELQVWFLLCCSKTQPKNPMVLDFQSLTLGPHYVCLQPYLFTFQGRGWQRRENMRVFLQTLISHNFLCVQNRAFHAAKSGDVAWEETQGQWAASPFAPLWARSAPYLYSSFLKTNSVLPQPLHLSSFFFPFRISHFLWSSARGTGGETGFRLCLSPTLNMLTFKLLRLLFLHYPLMTFSSITY